MDKFEHEKFLDELAALARKYKIKKISVDVNDGAVVFSGEGDEFFLTELVRFKEFEDQTDMMIFDNITVNYNYYASIPEDEK